MRKQSHVAIMAGVLAGCGAESGGRGTGVWQPTTGSSSASSGTSGSGSGSSGSGSGGGESGEAGSASGDPGGTDGPGDTGRSSDSGASSSDSGAETGSGSTGSSGGGSGTTGDDGGGLRFDVGGGEDVPNTDPTAGGGERCQKVDFLFVIDNSGSMEDEQQNLVASFPGFISGIRDVIDVQDFRIMVTDSDADATTSGCPGSPGDPSLCANWCTTCPAHCSCVCQGTPCPPPPPTCDTVLGAGQVKDQDGADCGVTGGGRYMTQAQPALDTTFSCVALVGTSGDGNERPMDAAVDAVTTLNGAGQCNESFVRSDAVLVVTVITDEEDAGKSAGTPATWKQSIVDAKGGDENAVVALAIVGDPDIGGGVCNGADAEASPRLRTWAESFNFGQWGSICAPDYAPFFENAISVIDTACEDFVPPG